MTTSAADSNRLKVSYWEETTYGEAPTSNPTLTDLRIVSENLRQDTQSIVSNEIRPDRQRADLIRTGIQVLGSLGIELSYDASHRKFMEYGLLSSGFSTAVVVTDATISFAVSSGGTQVISDSNSGFGSITVGSWVTVTGADDANNGTFKVKVAAAGAITVTNASGTLQVAGSNITVTQLAQIVNSTTLTTAYFEKHYTDIDEFAYYTGCAFNTFGLTTGLQQIITGTFDLIGKKETSAATTLGDGTNTAGGTDQVMNTIDHITAIYENETALDVTQFDFSLNNNLRNRLQLGVLGPCGVGVGSIDITGTLQKYLESETVIDKYLNWTDTSLAIICADSNNQTYVFDFPRVKFTSGQRVGGGVNQDILADLNWTAYRDETEGITCRIAIGA